MTITNPRVLAVLTAILILAAIIGALALGPHHLAAMSPQMHYYE
jgi:hypothetical protein